MIGYLIGMIITYGICKSVGYSNDYAGLIAIGWFPVLVYLIIMFLIDFIDV